MLDTHVVLWQLDGSRDLGARAQETIAGASELLFSVVSFAEIGVKASVGKLTIPQGMRDHVVESGLRILGLQAEHGLAVAKLPLHHRDPFDRLLVAQAIAESLTLVTSDERIAEYDVALVDPLS